MPSTLQGIIEAEVSRLVAEHHPRMRRNSATFAGQLAGDIVTAFLALSEDQQIAAARNRGQLGRDIVQWMLGAGKAEQSNGSSSDPEPWYVEEWAGPVAGPTVLENEYGIPRSTLYRWQKLNLVAFQKGRRKFVFPLRQFVDGRPVDSLSGILGRFQDHRAAWLWLIQPCEALAGEVPIDLLRSGRTAEATEAAKSQV